VGVSHADGRFRADQQRWSQAPACPLAAPLVKRIIDPGQRARRPGVAVNRSQLPMGVCAPQLALEGQVGKSRGQTQLERQILVGLVLPAGAPHQLKAVGELAQVLA
jgi:hypothetical protein